MRLRTAAGAIAALVVLFVFYRLFIHGRNLLEPALVMPRDDVHVAVSQALDARATRLFRDPAPGSRDARPKLVALTFDDGPYAVETPLLLATLRDLDVHATFFLIGRDAEQFPALTRRITAAGHEIADHTATHPNLDRLAPEAVRAELVEGSRVLEAIAPDPSERRFFRPPHGRYTEETLRIAQALDYTTVLWNDDAGDWRADLTAAQTEKHLLDHATAPEIVLLHSGKLATVAMLPELTAAYRKAGYTFVTVGELLKRVAPGDVIHPERRAVPAPAS
jgi:peptidoglycan/xylan/chitin deacetylase (PgdA/CDA1 family)